MEKIKSLNSYQKGILIFMIAMVLVFAIVYPKTISKVGFDYKDTIFVPSEENGNTTYSAKMNGKDAYFIVSADKTVVFHYGDKVYGPYTAKEDPTAIPKDKEMSSSMTGVELHDGEDILFRGGVLEIGEVYWLYNEDGTDDNIGITYVTGDGIERDENGNPVDVIKPPVSTILKLMNNPELTHKGKGFAWLGAVFICILNAITILFSDELFRFSLAFRIRYADNAEPSDWEIAGRYVSWTAMTIVALTVFIMGLI